MKQISINNRINLEGHKKAEALGLRFCTKCKENKDPKFFDFPRGGNSAIAWCMGCRSMKTCPKCTKSLPRNTHFQQLTTGKKRIHAYCLDCDKKYQRSWRLGANYQLSSDEYEDLLSSQNGVCLLCGSSKRLVVDHDHETGKVRGILCDLCNRGLGYFKDSKEALLNAVEYLGGVSCN